MAGAGVEPPVVVDAAVTFAVRAVVVVFATELPVRLLSVPDERMALVGSESLAERDRLTGLRGSHGSRRPATVATATASSAAGAVVAVLSLAGLLALLLVEAPRQAGVQPSALPAEIVGAVAPTVHAHGHFSPFLQEAHTAVAAELDNNKILITIMQGFRRDVVLY